MNIVLIVIVIVVVLLIIYVFATYNKLVKLRNKVEESFSSMDIYLKKRWDLLPNLIEIVKGYTEHENDTLKKLVELRNSSYEGINSDTKIEVNKKIEQVMPSFIALAENYPDLKASSNYIELSSQLSKIEEDIANSRKNYNGSVKDMNDHVLVFPTNLVAGILGFKKLPMYEITSEERENIKVEF